MKMLLKTLLFVLSFGVTLSSLGQNGKGIVSGNVTDSTGKQPIVYATVSIMNIKDTTVVTYRLTDEKGTFKITALPLHTELKVVITAMGHSAYRQDFFLTDEIPQLHLTTVKMQTTSKQLDEVLILGERPPVVVGKDTIEFNADAFKTLPSAMLEDLLKKFPGLELDDDGTMTINGRPVNKILVEGKEFFGNNQRMATKNLPANLISRVQVTDDKEQLARNPDINPSELGQIVNLKLKRNVKQGVFGKINAGVGTNDRYAVNGNVNTFRDKLHVSFVGNINNNNMNNGSSGIPFSSSGGININTNFNKKTSLSVNYNYNSNKNFLLQTNFNRQFLGDTTIFSNSNTERNSGNSAHRVSAYLKIKIDSVSTFEYRPSVNFGSNYTNSIGISDSYRFIQLENLEERLNDGNNRSTSSGTDFGMEHEVSYQKTFRKRGRNMYVTANFNIGNNDGDRLSNVINNFYLTDRQIETNQLRMQQQNNTGGRVYLSYNEPIWDRFSLRFTQTLNWSNQKDYTDTYGYDITSGLYDDLLTDLTNGLRRGGIRSNTGLGLRYKKDELLITPGVSLQILDFKNSFRTGGSVPQAFQYILPTFQIRYDRFTFNYRANVSEPSVGDLQPVTNNSNPLYITLGNPDLKPSIAHTMDLNMEKFNVEKLRNYSFNVSGSMRNNAVIRARTVDSNGAQTTIPVNVDGLWNANMVGRISKQWKFSEKWKFSLTGSGNVAYRQGMMILNDSRTVNTTWNAGGRGSLSFNWMDKLEIEQSYGPDYSENSYGSAAFQSINVWRHNARTGLVVRLPKQFVWDTQFSYSYNPQVATGMPKAARLWNAGLGYLFLKNDAAQVRISVYDLLNQNFRVSRSVSENFIRDSESNILNRYFMVSLSYNLRNFGGRGARGKGNSEARGGSSQSGGNRGGGGNAAGGRGAAKGGRP